MSAPVRLSVGGACATIALQGAEPMSWQVGGRELLWHGDPEHWAFRAPLLFPVVGASAGGVVRVDGATYPMPQHGFARHLPFELVERSEAWARLRLADSEATRKHYPFAFQLDVVASLARDALRLDFTVTNTGAGPMPYGLGVHPAFPWPFDADDRDGHRIVFGAPQSDRVPEVAPGGLLARTTRPVPMRGRELALSPDLFAEALVFLNADASSIAFTSPSGAAIELRAENLPHLAVWTKPTAPFLSLEAWSTHADWEDFAGELSQRDGIALLAPGGSGRHAAAFLYRPVAKD